MSTKETEVNMDMDIRHPVDGWTIDRQLMIMAMQSYEIPREVNLKKERERDPEGLYPSYWRKVVREAESGRIRTLCQPDK